MGPLQFLFGGMTLNEGGRKTPSREEVVAALIAAASEETKEAWMHVLYADWWWSQQPEPIKELRKVQNFAERRDKALALARQGYLIDGSIVVAGVDPLAIMELRRKYGYTWIPAYDEKPILVAPGVTFPGLPSYDPSNPPPRSIPVDPNPRERVKLEQIFDQYDLALLLTMASSNGIAV